MPVKREEPTTQMLFDTVGIQYDTKMLLSCKDAATIMEILSRANLIKEVYNEDKKFISGVDKTTFTPIPTKEVNELKKAAFLGISHTKYLEGINAKSRTNTSEESV